MPFCPPKVALAPMAGITDAAFRAQVVRYGVDLTMSEMIATHVLDAPRAGSAYGRLEGFGETEQSEAVQLAGRNPDQMRAAAAHLAAKDVPHIDINMGCPAKKVTGGAAGAALMQDLPLAQKIIKAVRDSFNGNLSVKMRLGWDEASFNAPELARIAEGEGAQMLTVHGRTRQQFYKGEANWHKVARIVDHVAIPVLVNGDIVDISGAKEALRQSGACGVMIGRGSLGRPWVPAQIRAELIDLPPIPAPSKPDFIALVQAQYRQMIAQYPRDIGYRCARKHLGWYMDVANTNAAMRRSVLKETNPEKVNALLAVALGSYQSAPRAPVAA